MTTDKLPLVVALAALAVAGGTWFTLSRDVRDLRRTQQVLADDLAEARGVATIDVAGAPARGAADAVVTLVEFSDYECPYCIRYTREILPEVDRAYVANGRIRYVFKDFPIDQLHPEAIRAHEAGQCAAEQGRFWEVHYRLFSAAGTHTPAGLEAVATEAGLDLTAWRECVASGRTREAIRASASEAAALGASGTPVFFVGLRDIESDRVRLVRAITGAQPFEVFQQTLDAVLAQVD
ncbi:MAG TPA: thioredoxin domain-containing protein [Vicinamibacterales bacterium]|nr:thioredoxin domain-containing protein [Vicinamibacterales bacterium]